MKKPTIILTILVLCLTLFSQELQHETGAINIEVPVRVYKGNNFVDNLTLEDFEVYEEGVLHKIEAVYLIRKTEIKRKEIKRNGYKSDYKYERTCVIINRSGIVEVITTLLSLNHKLKDVCLW